MSGSELQKKAARIELTLEQQLEDLSVTYKLHSKEALSSGPVFLRA